MSNEISGNSGYLAVKIQTDDATAVVPTVFVPFESESLTTEMNHGTDTEVYGNKFARREVTPGIRSHGGEITVLAEPNSTAIFCDTLMTRGTMTGSNPYTWPFTFSFTNPKSATWDISNGRFVSRFVAVQISEMSPDVKDNKTRWKLKVSALKSFLGAKIASAAAAVVTLDTTSNPTPTDGLVVGDLIRVWVAAGTTTDYTIVSLTTTTVTLSGSPTVSAGDMLMLRPASSPSLNLLAPFLWSRTEFRVAADAATALSATHTPMSSGSEWSLMHAFDDDKGDQRSGSADPAALPRKSVDATVKLKKFFYDPLEIRRYQNLEKLALVIRYFSGTGHEFRLTFNNLKITKGGDKPLISTEETEYYELELTPNYDTSDAQAVDVKVINGLSSL